MDKNTVSSKLNLKALINSFISCILILSLTFSAPSPLKAAAETKDDETVLIAASDWQHPDGNEGGLRLAGEILSALERDGIAKADGLLFCGDYDYDTYGDPAATNEGITSLISAFDGFVDRNNVVLAQGNHDYSDPLLSPGGNNDPKDGKYGVFVINNDDYMWHNSDEERIIQTANKLEEYLAVKAERNSSEPIFIVSHLALHYSMRTANDGDGMYAKHIFDVINQAGSKGLNIIYLYGHNHSNGWDDYLGGASVFLPKGDKILIGQNSRSEFKEETLSFTYMNAGFLGYYSNHNGADDSLTVTVFKITDDRVEIFRYDSKGSHPLKSAGVSNSYKNETAYPPNETVYSSPQTITVKPQTVLTEYPPLKEPEKSNLPIVILIVVCAIFITASPIVYKRIKK